MIFSSDQTFRDFFPSFLGDKPNFPSSKDSLSVSLLATKDPDVEYGELEYEAEEEEYNFPIKSAAIHSRGTNNQLQDGKTKDLLESQHTNLSRYYS